MATSYFDALFRSFGVPSLMGWNADHEQLVHYDDGRIEADLRAIIQDRSTFERELLNGSRVKVEQCTIVFSTDENSGLGAVPNPQINSIYTFDGAQWVVDLDGEQPGLEAVTGNLARVRLRKLTTVAQGYPDLYRRS
jgi:hypothetical protein